MARIVRIDKVTVHGDNINIEYTAGTAPLPVTGSGQGFQWTRSQLAAKLEELEQANDETLVLMRFAATLKADPMLVNPDAAKGKWLSMDLTGGTAVFAQG